MGAHRVLAAQADLAREEQVLDRAWDLGEAREGRHEPAVAQCALPNVGGRDAVAHEHRARGAPRLVRRAVSRAPDRRGAAAPLDTRLGRLELSDRRVVGREGVVGVCEAGAVDARAAEQAVEVDLDTWQEVDEARARGQHARGAQRVDPALALAVAHAIARVLAFARLGRRAFPHLAAG